MSELRPDPQPYNPPEPRSAEDRAKASEMVREYRRRKWGSGAPEPEPESREATGDEPEPETAQDWREKREAGIRQACADFNSKERDDGI